MALKSIEVKKTKESSIFLYYGKNMKKASIIFIIGILLGGMLVIYSQKGNIVNFEFIKENDLEIGKKPTFSSIFFNNYIVGIILVMGIVYGRIINQIVLILNGIMLGVVVFSYIYTYEMTTVLLSLLPHSCVEICCLLFCSSIGMCKYKKYKVKDFLILFGIITLGFAIAAFIEVNISYNLAQKLM